MVEFSSSPKAETLSLIINVDGASRGNPGAAAIGVIIRDANGRIALSISNEIGRATNNQSEYKAIISALEAAHRIGAKRVQLFSDSELVVRQLKGYYRVKQPGLKPLFQRVKQLERLFDQFEISHIPREFNAEADRLANMALDSASR